MFLSERNVKRQLFRVKQLADQTFARAEKSEVLTDDLVNAEKRVELIKHVCSNAVKKIQAGLQGQGTDGPTIDKRLKKLPDFQLASTMLDSSSLLGETSILGSTMFICGKAESEVASCLLTHEVEIEKLVVAKLQEVLDNDIPSIAKIKKQLSKLTLDMDSAKTRHVNATRHSIPNLGNTTKVENIKEELDDATARVVQCKDALAEEMFSLLAKEHDLSQCVLHLVKSQADYHRKVLGALEGVIPNIEKVIENHSSKPVYGFPLEEHLRINERKIALPIETCVCFLMECGLEEEGLFRIAGSSSKVKKLKNAFDAGYVDMTDYVREPHAVAGALKQYLRELPLPLMTFNLYEEWLDTARHTETDARVKAMWNVIRELPEPYYNNLRYLVKFLSKLTDLQEVNKMSPQNVAIVMGPNLMWSQNEDPSTLGMNMSLANTYSSIVDLLIEYSGYFFEGEEEFFVTTPKNYLAEYLISMFPPTSADSISNGDIEDNALVSSVLLPGSGGGPPLAPGDVDLQIVSGGNNKSPKLPRRMKKPAPPVPPAPNVASTAAFEPPTVIASPSVERSKASSLPERPPISERPRGHERKSSWLASDVLANKTVEPEFLVPAQPREDSVQPTSPSSASKTSSNVTTNSNVPQFSTFGLTSPSGSGDGTVSSHGIRPQPVPRPNQKAAKTQGNGSCSNGESIASGVVVVPSTVVVDDCPFVDDENPIREADGTISPPSPVRRNSLENAVHHSETSSSKVCETSSEKCKERPPRPANLPFLREDNRSGSIIEKPDRLARTRSLRNAGEIGTQRGSVKHSTNSVDRCRVKQNYVNISDVFRMDSDDEDRSVESLGDNSMLPPPERPEKFDRSKIVPPVRPVKSDRLKSLLDHVQGPSSSKKASLFGSVVKEKPARPPYSPSSSSSSSKDGHVNRVAKDDAKPQQSVYPSLSFDVSNDVGLDVACGSGPPTSTSTLVEDLTPRRQVPPSSPVCPSSPGLLTASSSSVLPSKPPRPQPRPPLPPVARPRSVTTVNPEQTHL